MDNFCLRWVVLGSLLWAVVNAKGQNLIANGGFESPAYSNFPYYRYIQNNDTSGLTAWRGIDDGVGEPSYVFNEIGYSSISIHSGAQSVQINQGSGLETTVAITGGVTYELSFEIWSTPKPQLLPLEVSIGGVVRTFESSVSSGYVHQSMTFTAAASDAAAVLRVFNPSPVGDFKSYLIDSMELTVIPEPWVAGYVGVALGGLCVLWSQRVKRR